MTDIDTRPTVVNIFHYAGDTLTMQINTNGLFGAGTWTGQVRAQRDQPVDATFTITPNAEGASAVLSAADAEALSMLGVPVTVDGIPYTRYTGVYDIQVTEGAVVATVVRGTITVDSDVTQVV